MSKNKEYIIADYLGNKLTENSTLDNPKFDNRVKKAKIYISKEIAIKECEIINKYFDEEEIVKVYELKETLIDIENPVSSTTYVCGEKIENVYKIANNTLYFDDRSDYKKALYEILKELNPNFDEYEKLKYIE